MKTVFLFISGQEIFFILIIVVMLFGADKIPELARGLGKGMRQIKDATNEIKKDINESAKNNRINDDITKELNEKVTEVRDNIEDITGPIKRNM
ncbi:MAG: twin-arginine translocase TatA/TatE family subunit [Flavobacteriia bacterium]|nr:twin-arginine translocase TatA/TatE family subunit [Flavobacteriia bacterium]OIP45534.1 MAG: Sec-independent protein translocase TatA [Flavobacteriaceae bacterium CG2_30_31_66]PIV96788.1 MAG: twin-arginine translocase TatA/TatE family subunit [Flavobacteriaceae bacterium CG17_big_fil_post_rev_8_21_14_2_50_31_13]PIX11987.1 MAG: twin-arginine translocase TatA/TatE family subunit [Flavobacteriaceae bacterium CG_4_8_14_3_um_filter_31_8]PIY14961.1 MAG: twin-arginine translocase TatA/TatE family s